MRKENSPSNSELIQRLKTLLAESDQRSISQTEETNQETLEDALQIILKDENDLQQNAHPEEINDEIQEETAQELSSNEVEIEQMEPSEEVKQEPVGKNDISAQFKNKLPEGGNMPQVSNYDVNYKNIVIKTSDGSVISGKTNINVFGRLTEYLKQGTDNFITVVSEEEEDASKRVTVVNKNYIIWANTWD